MNLRSDARPEAAAVGRRQPSALRWFGVPSLMPGSGQPTVFRAERPYQLLAYLACRDDWVGRDELAALFWPDRPQSAARGNLRKVLLVAERSVGLPLERQADRLRWRHDSDLARIEAASAAGRHDEVLALYRPPLMAGLDAGLPPGSTDWLAFKRQHVEGLWRRAAAARLGELAEAPAAAALLAEALLEVDALDDMALLALGQACLALDQSARGLRALQAHAERLAAEYAIEPSASLRALADRLRGGPPAHRLESQTGAASTLPLIAGGGPAAVAAPSAVPGFIGRRLELAQLGALLAEASCRVVTILGPGGIGKSSIAIASLAELGRRFDRGTAWLPLGDLRNVADVPGRVAGGLGLELRGDAEAWPQIESHLAARPRLLVFDNVEHLDGFAAALAALLDALPALKAVVTSRARLSIAGEWLLPLDGLPLPDLDETNADVLRSNDSVRLFEARALASAPGFGLAAQAVGVVRLLHRIEGLPLAIELAAAWVRLLPAAEIDAELERSLDLLDRAATAEAAPGKDCSLRSSFAWSWQLIGPAERAALGRLAFLPGPFDRAMAAQAADVALPLVGALVDKSLLRADGAGRFSLHPLLRQCALERAQGTLDTDLAARRHAAYMAQWLARFEDPSLYASTEALGELDREQTHVRAAWHWSVANREPELIVRGAPALMRYLDTRGAWAEGCERMAEAVDAFVDATPAAQRARLAAAGALAQLQIRRGRFADGEAVAGLALDLAIGLGHRSGLKSSVNLIGMALYRQGRHKAAREYFERSLGYAREDGDQARIAMLCSNLAIVESALGRYPAALALYRESATLARSIASAPSLAAALNNMATVQIAVGDAAGALASAAEALALYTSADLRSRRPFALLNMAEAQHQLGAAADATRLYEDGLAAARESGEPDSLFEGLLGSARLAAEAATPQRLLIARSRLAEAIAVATTIGSDAHRHKAVLVHAQIVMSRGERGRALALAAWALSRPGLDPVQARSWRERHAETVPEDGAGVVATVPANTSLADIVATMELELGVDPTPRNGGETPLS